MVVKHGCEQVVGCADGVQVAGEMEVDVFHWYNLRIPAAGCAALNAEDWAEGRFAQRDHGLFTEAIERVGNADGRGGLSFAGWRWVDGSNENDFRIWTIFEHVVVVAEIDLGFVLAVVFDVFIRNVELCGDVVDRLHGRFLCNFNIRFESH